MVDWPEYRPALVMAPASAGIGLEIPPRRGSCRGGPSWESFQLNICDAEFDPVDPDLTGRQLTVPPAP